MASNLWRVAVAAGILFPGFHGRVFAEQYAFAGARATGMGGANAASVNDATAQWQNPAAFGCFGSKTAKAIDNGNLSSQGFSWELFGGGGGYALTGDMGRYLDILSDIDFNVFDQGNLSSDPKNVNDLLAMAGIVGSLGSSDALYADASAGTSIQIGHFGVGVRMFGEAGAWTVPDTGNLALGGYANPSELASEIQTAANNDTSFTGGGGYTFTTLTSDQRNQLAADLNIAGSADDSIAIQYLDSQLGNLKASGDLTGSEIDAAVGLFGSFTGGGSIDSNLTAVVGRGFALAEVPVSYGWAINGNLSVGVTAKLMYGSVLGTKIWIFNDNNDQVLEDLSDNKESSLNVGIDAGLLYRLPKCQFALVGHNLNRPSFNGFTDTIDYTVNGGAPHSETITVPDVKIDPQLTAGAAFMPSKRLTLEGDLDLLKAGTLLPGYDIQRISFGGELDLWLLALRAGAYKNLAASWQDWVATAGVGINLAGVKVDVGGAYSLGNTVEYDGNDIPSEARLYASIGLDF